MPLIKQSHSDYCGVASTLQILYALDSSQIDRTSDDLKDQMDALAPSIMVGAVGDRSEMLKILQVENTESELYFGSVKPEAVTFDLGGVATIRFAMKNKPVEYVVLESFGEDSIFVSNVRLLVGGIKYSVCGVQKTGGKVINEQNLTKCDTTFAELGESSGIKHLDDVSLAKIPNGVKLYFDKIV